MAGPQNQNPRGERLTPVLLKQGLVLSPPSLGQFGKMASSMKHKIKTRGLMRESVATARLFHQTLKEKRP
jgi:hypothetical protein